MTFYTVAEVANITGLTDRTIRNYLKDGVLRGQKVGGQWRFSEEDVKNLFQRKEVKQDMNQQTQERIARFLSEDKQPDGKKRVCCVADIPCDGQTAFRYNEAICRFIAENGKNMRYDYAYDEKNAAARYTVFGDPAFVSGVLNLLA